MKEPKNKKKTVSVEAANQILPEIGKNDLPANYIDYKAIFEHSIDAFILISFLDGKIIEVNDAALKLLGYTRNEFLELKAKNLVSEDEFSGIQKIYNNNKKSFDETLINLDFYTKKRKKIPVSVSVKKLKNKDHHLLIARDITGVKQTEEALKRESFIFENLHDAVVITDLKGYIQSWNNSASKIFGYEREEILNSFIDVLFKHKQFEKLFKQIKKIIREKSLWNSEINIIRNDGAEGIAEISMFPFRDSSAEHIAYVLIIKDVTVRKLAEQEMRERDLMYRSLIESSSDAIYVLKHKKLLLVNSAWCNLFGYTKEEATSENFDIMDIVAPESKRDIEKRFAIKLSERPEHSSYEMKGKTKDNRVIDLDVKVNKILWKGEEVYQGIYRDITFKKKSEIELKESEDKFRRLSEKSLVGVYLIQGGIFKYVNPKLAEIFGYETKELINKLGPEDLTAPEDRSTVEGNIKSRLRGEKDSIAYSFRGFKKDHSLIYVDVFGSRTTFSGEPAIIGTLLDVTDRKKTEEAIRISEKKYRTIIEAANDAIVIVDTETRKIVDANKQVETLTGRTRNELIGQPHYIIHPEEYKEEYSFIFSEVVSQQQREISPAEVIVQHKDGTFIPVEINSSKYSLGGRAVLQGIFRDLRERRKTEEEIRKLSRAVEQSPLAIIITDTNGAIEYVNPHFYKVTGYTADEMMGENPRILKSGETPDDGYRKLWETISSGKEWHGEFHNKKKNGELYWEHASISPIRDEKGIITHYIAIKEDITNRKKMQQELVVAKEKAEESDKMKSEFLSQMSHEIRTPLNVILSYNSFLKDELSSSLNEDIKLSFNSIDSAGKRLLRTIDMILNLAAIQKGKIDINFDPVDIIRILNTLATEFNFQAKEKNLYLNYITPSEKIIVIGDEYLITGVFQNLLSNALKYTNEGGVEIEVAGLSENKVRVNIKDTGIGISENYLPKLFLPFTQEETGYTRKFEGNGLGLALVKNYMDLLQAEIKVESEKGRGTTFSIFFNLANNAS
jgi:hypothetical protein